MHAQRIAKERYGQTHAASSGIIENPCTLSPCRSKRYCQIIIATTVICLIAAAFWDPARWRGYLFIGAIVWILYFPGRLTFPRSSGDR